jgi:hypothetical protein
MARYANSRGRHSFMTTVKYVIRKEREFLEKVGRL